MKNKTKKLIFAVVILGLVIAFGVQQNITQVRAKLEPVLVQIDHINFGLVFPGEQLAKYFTVNFVGDDEELVEYSIIQYPKPKPDFEPDGEMTAREYCIENPEDTQNCYLNLCEYLIKTSTDGEGDIEELASVGPNDLQDEWQVELSVPAIAGYVAQNHTYGIIDSSGDYGCDIAIDINWQMCTLESEDFGLLDRVDIGNASSESTHSISGWSDANLPGNYGGCQQGAVCDYRQLLGEPGDGQCSENDRPAEVVLSVGENEPIQLKMRHLDGISLLDSFNVYINDILVGTFNDDTQESSEIWRETDFDLSSYNFSGDLTIRLEAIDEIWNRCLTYGQVSIDWIEISGCGDEEQESYPICGNDVIESGEECDDGNTEGGDGCSASCQNEVTSTGTSGGPACGDRVRQSGEECDYEDGLIEGYYCTEFCRLEPIGGSGGPGLTGGSPTNSDGIPLGERTENPQPQLVIAPAPTGEGNVAGEETQIEEEQEQQEEQPAPVCLTCGKMDWLMVILLLLISAILHHYSYRKNN